MRIISMMLIKTINLDRRVDRFKLFLEKYKKIPGESVYKLERFSAIDGRKLNINPEYAYLLRHNTYDMRRAVFATALSHMYLWQELIGSDSYNMYFIMEDDVDFNQNFHSYVEQAHALLKKLPEDEWDFCFTGYVVQSSLEKYSSSEDELQLDSMLGHPYYSGAFGYIINKSGAQKMLGLINQMGLKYPVDTLMLYAMRGHLGRFNVLCTLPRLVFSEVADVKNGIDSDIQRDFLCIACKFKILMLGTSDNECQRKLITCLSHDMGYRFCYNSTATENYHFIWKNSEDLPDEPNNDLPTILFALNSDTGIRELTNWRISVCGKNIHSNSKACLRAPLELKYSNESEFIPSDNLDEVVKDLHRFLVNEYLRYYKDWRNV
jgi:GR25 family glycosyltransferase involved in LPS biosynthesis